MILQRPGRDPATGHTIALESPDFAVQLRFKRLHCDPAESYVLLEAAKGMAYGEFSPKTFMKGAAQEGGGIPSVPSRITSRGHIKLGEFPEITHELFVAPLNKENTIPTVANHCGKSVEVLSGLCPARFRDPAL